MGCNPLSLLGVFRSLFGGVTHTDMVGLSHTEGVGLSHTVFGVVEEGFWR